MAQFCFHKIKSPIFLGTKTFRKIKQSFENDLTVIDLSFLHNIKKQITNREKNAYNKTMKFLKKNSLKIHKKIILQKLSHLQVFSITFVTSNFEIFIEK